MSAEETFDRISHAFVRKPGKNFAQGLNIGKGVPDAERALFQHDIYCETLVSLGVDVKALRTDPAFPDGCFIADMAVIAGNLAVLGNFAENNPRQGEQQAISSILAGARFLKYITAPGRLDASDVLRIRGHFYIGLSDHTNAEGAAQLAAYLAEFGHPSSILPLDEENVVRLKTTAVYLGAGRLLVREELARNFAFLEFDKIIVPYEERFATNAVMVNGTLVMPKGYPKTALELKIAGIPTAEINLSEFEKMNGGAGCLSLRMEEESRGNVVLMPSAKKGRAA